MNKQLLFFSAICLCILSCKKDNGPSNEAPVANGINITGVAEATQILTAAYTYADAEDDLEGETTFQWYVANDANGTGITAISGANESTYMLKEEDAGKFIGIGITPKAETGTLSGSEAKSSFKGPVTEASTITFQYNGNTVTYGILTSAATGKKWMDRNLGAANAPTSKDDYANWGDLFQWGRPADGHQLVVHTGPTAATITTTTTTLATNTAPGHANFILAPAPPSDWLATQNANLWQGVDGTNNPCPDGWKVPTKQEWDAEGVSLVSDGFTKLKLTFTGARFAGFEGYWTTNVGNYWSSTVDESGETKMSIQARIADSDITYESAPAIRASGFAVRCIKN